MMRHISVVAVAGLFAVAVARPAHAQSILKSPGSGPKYSVELEPHLLLGPWEPPGSGQGQAGGYGGGMRASIPIIPEGFIKKLNNSVALGFGVDYLHYPASNRIGPCTRWVTNAAGGNVCVETWGNRAANVFYIPVVMQWNFWFTKQLSAFGEPGLAVNYVKDDGVGLTPVMQVGGRWHFAESVALTLRLGYPSLSLGASFLF